MAAEGAAVAMLGRTEATLQQVAAQIEQQGGRALALRCDVSVPEEVERAFAVTIERFGRLDVVVANAAVQLHGADRPIHELSEEIWDRTHEINLRGAFLTCRAGIRQFLAQGQGG